ncbi:hypothetical protein KUH03_21430 [Sphingobacterium sp. E70]|nr:hypothetical protein [Sphingobacterium sp. E70]ULT22090.1 hypothetical protein KUH03_21430 [Sphingobacterium sp. E70]
MMEQRRLRLARAIEGVHIYEDNVKNFFTTGYNQKHSLAFEGEPKK